MMAPTRRRLMVSLLALAALGLAVWLAVGRPSETAPREAPGRTPGSEGGTAPAAPAGALAGLEAPAPESPKPGAPVPRKARSIEGALRPGPVIPAAGIRLWAVPLQGSAPPDAAWVESDARGMFRFENLGPGPHRIVGRIGPLSEEIEIAASVEPGAAFAEYDVPLPIRQAPLSPRDPGGVGRVRILGHDGGVVARAQVGLRHGERVSGYLDVLEGVFRRPPFETWTTSYEVSVPLDAEDQPLPYGPLVHRFEDSGEQEATLRMPPERVVEGRVVGPDGEGVPDLEILAIPDGGPALPHASARTAADGTFRMGNLGAQAYRLETSIPPPLLPSGPWGLDPTDARIELRVRAGVGVTLQVTDVAGQGIPGVSVAAMVPGAFAGPGPGPNARSGQTDHEGRVTLENLDPEGTYLLSLTPPQARGDLQARRIEGWKTADGVHVLEPGFLVRGVVRNARGEHVAGFVNRKMSDGSFRPLIATSPEGVFEVRGLPAGPITLAAAAGPGRPNGPEVTVDASANAVTLELPPD